jgi:hypothetical protein
LALDGDAADWLDFHLLFPMDRYRLMQDGLDEIAIATHGDPAVGFGAAALVYRLLTPAREAELGNELAESIAEARKGRPTQRLENPPELEATALEIAKGRQPHKAFSATLMRLNIGSKNSRYLAGLVFPLDGGPPLSPVAPLRNAKALTYGIVVTHVTEPSSGWARPMAFVWFVTERPPEREASLSSAPMFGKASTL